MSGKSAFIYHPVFEDRGLSPFPSVWQRYSLTKDLLTELGVIPHAAQIIEPRVADEKMLHLAHDKDYVDFVRKKSEEGRGYLDYGDTPAYPGVFLRASASAGASACGARIIGKGESLHAFNPGGGLHHARFASAGGFCVFNDIAVAVRIFHDEFDLSRVAIVDIDGHHADGTQDYFYDDKTLTVSLHRYDRTFYPGSGAASEIGTGEGKGYCVNVPLPARIPGDLYLNAFNSLVPPVLKWYEPEVIILQCGVDGHYQDPLVRMYLTTLTYEAMAKSVHELAHELCDGRLLLLGGGGYSPENVARCWAVIFSTITGASGGDSAEIYKSLHDSELKDPGSSLSVEVEKSIDNVKEIISRIHGDIFQEV